MWSNGGVVFMYGTLSTIGGDAIAADGRFDGEKSSAVKSDGNWFSVAARALYPSKGGTALHYVTGGDERLCQKYAAGTVKPPAYFLRALLRSEHGWQWLAALMDGSEARWWSDIQRARLDSELLRKFVDEITQRK